MPLRNSSPFLIVVILLSIAVVAQSAPGTTPTQNQPAPPPSSTPGASAPQQPPPQGAPQPSQDEATPRPPNQPGDTVQVPAGQGQDIEQQGGSFVFKKQVEEVVLHATVIDNHQRLVTGLQKNDFQIWEDGQPQQITSFRREDIPVALGIVIDNSGSMRDKRAAVNQAAINLVKASNPHDEVFIVNFNDEYFLDQDFTSDVNLLKTGLEHIESRGGTALYDALVASADHLQKGARLDKKVLLVVTDGEDNASSESLEQAIRRLQVENGPAVYTIGILGDDREAHRAKRALTALALQTGGVAFFPKDVGEVDSISQQVAHDIRNQYTIGYKPTNPRQRGGYRSVKVEARAPGYGKLQVRTRSGYYAGQER
ncbi:MAG: VWA domain-containing protein, partial [Acidobacteriaceae bacterium]|nr:VWA domain-containing protein [Acidobacteriaceae bacterium]